MVPASVSVDVIVIVVGELEAVSTPLSTVNVAWQVPAF